MLAHTKKRLIKHSIIMTIHHAGATYCIPKQVADMYRVVNDESVSVKNVFAGINKKYSKPGALLRGIRIRDGLTQTQMAQSIGVTQSDISQMEHGIRNIGRQVAKRIEQQFGVDYRSFLA